MVKSLETKMENDAVDLTDEIATANAILQTEREAFPVKSDLPTDSQSPIDPETPVAETPSETPVEVETTESTPNAAW